jgi:hypothetical protein
MKHFEGCHLNTGEWHEDYQYGSCTCYPEVVAQLEAELETQLEARRVSNKVEIELHEQLQQAQEENTRLREELRRGDGRTRTVG